MLQLARVVILLSCILYVDFANAARRPSSDYTPSSNSHSQTMLADVSAHYLRDTKEGPSDIATRINIGGMFSQHVGLDFQAMYELKAKGYLLGVDLRINPVPWLYLKGGFGGFATREQKLLEIVPIGAMGIVAPIADSVYLLSDATFFQTKLATYLSFGAGLGLRF